MATAATALAVGTAGTSTAAATTGLFGAAGTFSFMQSLSTVGTLFSVGSVLGGGSAENKMYEQQARMDEIRARQEQIRGQQEATAIKEDLIKNIASANARGAAAGIDLSSGSPVTAVNEAINDANDAWSIARDNAANNADVYNANAYTARQKGKNAIRSSRSQAFGLMSDFAMKQADRGMTF